MISDSAAATAARLMSEFATRTGLSAAARDQQRYLWTDAFAVCNFLELFRRTGDQRYRQYATQLIDNVHQVLGRYRDDDMRSGWISGLDEASGRRHPTAGGLSAAMWTLAKAHLHQRRLVVPLGHKRDLHSAGSIAVAGTWTPLGPTRSVTWMLHRGRQTE
jgi:hypothetical protein